MTNIIEVKIGYIDFETTGLIMSQDKIVETALVCTIGRKHLNTYHQYYNPGFHIPSGASKVHKIYDDNVKNSPKFEDEIPKFFEALSEVDYCCAYNGIAFDRRIVLEKLLKDFKPKDIPPCLTRPWIDPLVLLQHENYRAIRDGLKNLKLTTVAKEVFKMKSWTAHNALEDTIALARMYLRGIESEIFPDTIEETFHLQVEALK